MAANWRLFERFGVEIEYMIVDRDTLRVRPIADKLLRAAAGATEADFCSGAITWSNELVLHVVELKTSEPASSLAGVAEQFQHDVGVINAELAAENALLLPTAMHPTMDPHTETKLWPHEFGEVYRTFDRIFDCRGHGWANLQSTHLNLSFAGDDEFARLYAALRVLLPLMPALTASTPLADGALTGFVDTRMEHYRNNARRIPFVSGAIVPEPYYTQADFEREVLGRIEAELAPHDPDGVIDPIWANARGAMARFDRGAVEVRVLDNQECPAADLALLDLIIAALRALVAERWTPQREFAEQPTDTLAALLRSVIRAGGRTTIANHAYLRLFGVADREALTAGELWRILLAACRDDLMDPRSAARLDALLAAGSLSDRIVTAVGPSPTRANIDAVYRELADCLAKGTFFRAAAPATAAHL